MDLRIGDTVYGASQDVKYTIKEYEGSGSFSIVYKVEGTNEVSLALKTISTASLNPKDLSALINEAQLATEINHENVIRIYFFHDGKKYRNLPPYMLLEYANGGTLRELIDERLIDKKYFSNDEIREMMIQLARGMEAINAKLVHRDIKPDNILIVDNKLKISDFGLSKIIGAITRSSTFKGINHIMYCAPEAWRQEKNTSLMDMYSLGIVYYEIATLVHPYKVSSNGDVVDAWRLAHFTQMTEDPIIHNPNVSQELRQIISKMMSKRHGDRYNNWTEVLKRLSGKSKITTESPEINKLVECAIETHQLEEQAKLNEQLAINKQREHTEIVKVAFDEIIESCKSVVDAYNKQSEHMKLEIKHRSEFAFNINVVNEEHYFINVSLSPVFNQVKIGDSNIQAWGYIKAPTEQGFNLLLLAKDDEIYGRWCTLHVKYSYFVRDRLRREPFAFEFNELPEEVHLLNATHIYQTEKKAYDRNMLTPLIEVLLRPTTPQN